jgi:predicted RNase H-related nuclease YkuK (DUF458 family)
VAKLVAAYASKVYVERRVGSSPTLDTIKTDNMIYKRMNGKEVVLEEYVQNYLKENEDVEILIGCDSQNQRGQTVYAVVVALYKRGKGAHIIYRRWKTPRERVSQIRLLNEVWFSVETAQALESAGIKKATWIDIDINPDPKYKSNEVFRQAVGLVEGLGFHCRYKTLGPIVTYTCDHLVKM